MAASARGCVLAAGKGVRMGGDRPKVLFEARGNPLLEWVLDALSAAGLRDIVCVVGFAKDEVVNRLPTGVRWVEQSPQLGTGHAVMCARPSFPGGEDPILVACGDMPLIRPETYRTLIDLRAREDADCALLTVRIPPESSFGRVLRTAGGGIERIVEVKDASPAERTVDEGNAGVYCFRPDALWDALERIGNENAQGEYYLTDVVEILLGRGRRITAHVCEDAQEALGVNTPADLEQVERVLREREEDEDRARR